MMSSRLRLFILLTLLAAMTSASLVSLSPWARAQEAGSSTDFDSNLPGDVALTMLASQPVDTLSTDPSWAEREARMELERVSLDPGESYVEQLRQRDPTMAGTNPVVGLALLYVETGEVTVARQGSEESYRTGEQTAVVAGQSYDIRNSGAECASVLRLSLHSQFPGGMGVGAPEEVPHVPMPCAESEDLLVLLDRTWPALPARIFLARMTLQPPWASLAPHAHGGPTGLVVESGQVAVDDVVAYTPTGRYRGVLADDGWAAFPSGVPYAVTLAGTNLGVYGEEPATMLVVGVIPEDEPWLVPLDFVSPAYGYRLAWDESWQVTGESWSTEELTLPARASSSWLRLENGTTAAQFEEFPGYGGDPERCLVDAISELRADPTLSDVEVMTEPGGQPIAGREATRAFAQFTFTATRDDAPAQDLVRYMECHTLVPGEAVLKVTADLPLGDADGQMQAVRELLIGLVLPEG
jgi:hypothetical protein